VGPAIPAHILAGPSAQNRDAEESDDDDDYGPSLPPDIIAARAPAPTRVIGPSFPPDSDSGSDVGPQPLPAGMSFAESDGVSEFMEREERRRAQIAEAAKPQKLQRDEWMLVPPSAGDVLSKLSVDPTKLKARQFRSTAAPAAERGGVDNSLWTETPQERIQRLADEVSGAKRPATAAPKEEEDADSRKRRKLNEKIKRGVDEHTRKTRSTALLDLHAKEGAGAKEEGKEKDAGIWDRDRDMGLGGRLMDDKTRAKIVADAKGLGDRFGAGKGGGF
ncbi:hypothetical protein FIBSPDRAFT_679698, partial [Athelia psychrophila]